VDPSTSWSQPWHPSSVHSSSPYPSQPSPALNCSGASLVARRVERKRCATTWWYPNAGVHRAQPSVPVDGMYRVTKQTFSYHRVALRRERMVDIRQPLTKVKSYRCNRRTDAVHKADIHGTRSVDTDSLLFTTCVDDSWKLRILCIDAAINILQR